VSVWGKHAPGVLCGQLLLIPAMGDVAKILTLASACLLPSSLPPGDHLRPMQQAVVDLPPEVARMANQAVATGGTLIGRLADMAQQMGVPQVRGWSGEGRGWGWGGGGGSMQNGNF
jgi:hypothetical protein